MKRETYKMLDRLMDLGIKGDDARALRRISITLHSWSEEECNGTIQRDEDIDCKPVRYYEDARGVHHRAGVIADREKGAQRRLAKIMARYPELWAYEQGDPRGCALYVGKQADLNGRDVDSCYNSFGVGIYK
jgi:hypothetical protein